MPISVTCQCGARLEIDEKFLGKEIPCPDCQRPLPTKAPSTPPPLDLPDYRRTSGLAVLSLALALVGAFTVVGTLAAIVVGVFAMREIANKPSKLEGLGYARAGVVLGAVCTFLTLAAFASPYTFGLDSILRQLALAPQVDFSRDEIEGQNQVKLTRPTAHWGKYKSPGTNSNIFQIDDLFIVNINEDAYIAYHELPFDGGVDDEEEKLKKIFERLGKSEIFKVVFRLSSPMTDSPVIVENKLVKGDSMREVIADLRNRRVLIRFPAAEKNNLPILVAIARRNRFERLVDDFRKTFDSKP